MQVQGNRRTTTEEPSGQDRGMPDLIGEASGPQIAAQIVEIAAQLVQAPASAEIMMLEWAFARIGIIAGASVVAARELRADGLLHFVAGWSRVDGLLDGEQPALRPRHLELPCKPISATKLADMPVVPARAEAHQWEQLVGQESPQSVFCPMIASERSQGFLCLVADVGIQWDQNVMDALSTVAALMTQFRARVKAERALQQQIAFNELQLTIGDRLLNVVSGEEDAALTNALAEIGNLLDVISIGVWEEVSNRQAQLTLRWLSDGIEGTKNPQFAVAIDSLPENVRFGHDGRVKHLGQVDEHLVSRYDDLDIERELLAVRMATIGGRGALVIGYAPGRAWEPWELTGLEAFANRIPVLRDRLAIEEQLVASFHAAPVGITIRNEDGRLVDCNDAFVNFLGYDSEMELLSTRPEDILAEDWASTEAQALRAEVFDDTRRTELPFLRKDGSTVWGRLSVRLLQLGLNPMSLAHIEDVTTERLERIQLEQRASTDELTGVANRRQMKETLSELLPTGHSEEGGCGAVAILLLDLDGFKEVNDAYGHAVGDTVLRLISQRIVGVSRDTDTVVRLGGDEFVVILPGPIKDEQATRAATRIRDAVAEPMSIDGVDIRLTVSIGHATHTGGNQSVEHLLAEADHDMYAAKRAAAAAALDTADAP